MCVLLYMYMYIQDHDPRVAETAVVGFPHDVYGEGNLHACMCAVCVCALYMAILC